MKRCLLFGLFSFIFLLSGNAIAQIEAPPPPKNPLSALAKKLAKPPTKAVAEKADKKAAQFKKGKTRLTFDELADMFSGGDKDAKKVVLQIMTEGARAFEDAAKKEEPGAENDVAIAMSFYLTSLHSISTGKELGEAEGDAFLLQIYSIFDTPEMKSVSDTDKQKFWEYCMGVTAFCIGMHEASEDKESKDAYKKLAGELFKTLLPIDTKNVQFTKDGMKITGIVVENGEAKIEGSKPVPPASATTVPAGKLSYSYTKPAGWKEEKKEGITILRCPEEGVDFRISILSFQPRGGRDIQTAFRELWGQIMKQHPDSKYVPTIATIEKDENTLLAFDGTKFLSESHTPELFLYIMEAGDYYLPIIVFWEKDGINFDLAENRIGGPVSKFIGSVKITGTSGHKSVVISKEQLSGTWNQLLVGSLAGYYSNSGSYVGDASTGGGVTLTINPNGTYEYLFALVSNGKSGYTDTHKGTWKLEGQTITLNATSASVKTQIKSHKFYVMGTGVGKNGEKKLIMTSADEDAQLARAFTYMMNYGNDNNTYTFKKAK
jgi:hypothetical protein